MTPTLAFLTAAAGLLCFGAHVVWPLRAIHNVAIGRRWSLLALPLGIAAAALFLLVAGQQPDVALAAGIAPGLPKIGARAATILVVASLLADFMILAGALSFAREKPPEPMAWRILAMFGLAGLLGWSWLAELLRAGESPLPSTALLTAAVLCRALIGLGAGEVLAVGRPWLAPFSAAALLAYRVTLPDETRATLLASGDMWTLGAAAILIGCARFLPLRLFRPALLAGTILAAFWFARLETLPRPVPPALLDVVSVPGSS